MLIARSATAATRLLLVVALAVMALLLASVADVAGDVSSSSRPSAAAPAGSVETGSGHGVRAEAVTAKRRAKKVRKTRKRAAAVATSAGAARWRGATLTYYDGLPSQWAWSLRAAVAQWNASGVGITLQPVDDPAAAQVRVGYGDIGGSSGLATVGPTTGAFVKLSDRYRSAVADQYDRVEVMGVLTHELGHVLGLEHVTTGCALMGPVMDIVGCGIYDMARPDDYRCDVIGDAALAQAVRLYGGAARARGTDTCTVGA